MIPDNMIFSQVVAVKKVGTVYSLFSSESLEDIEKPRETMLLVSSGDGT